MVSKHLHDETSAQNHHQAIAQLFQKAVSIQCRQNKKVKSMHIDLIHHYILAVVKNENILQVVGGRLR